MPGREEFEKWLKNNNPPNHAGMWEAWQESAGQMKEWYCSLPVEDWEELEKTINREKQLYTESDLKAAAERMKERCVEACNIMASREWYSIYDQGWRDCAKHLAAVIRDLEVNDDR